MKILKFTLAVALVALITASCSKDQKVVKQLSSGTWKVTAMTYNGESVPDSAYSKDRYTFEKCKVKKGDCDGVNTPHTILRKETWLLHSPIQSLMVVKKS
ncbi:MAG: hypothetical protein R2813_09060 [Flavobacteriales bacterium]